MLACARRTGERAVKVMRPSLCGESHVWDLLQAAYQLGIGPIGERTYCERYGALCAAVAQAHDRVNNIRRRNAILRGESPPHRLTYALQPRGGEDLSTFRLVPRSYVIRSLAYGLAVASVGTMVA